MIKDINAITPEYMKHRLEEETEQYKQEIEKLTELCNKYEEEHKTTFETWQKDIKENELLHSIIKEVREYIEKVETLAMVDKVNIFSMSTLKMILDKGE